MPGEWDDFEPEYDYDDENDEEEGPTCPECDAPVALEGMLCRQCQFWADGGA